MFDHGHNNDGQFMNPIEEIEWEYSRSVLPKDGALESKEGGSNYV